MNGYNLIRDWYNYKFNNSSKVKAIHSDFYCYLIDRWNRLGQKKEFGLPTDITMEALGIGSYNTYKKVLNDLIDFGFVIIVKKSINQHQSKLIALSKNDKALDKALDKATAIANDEALDKASDTIIKPINNQTNKQLIISSTPKNEFSESVNNFYDYVLKYFEEKFIPKTNKQISSWKECIDKLIRIDGYDLKHLHEIIKTFREDNFWKTNFNSLPKLREKNNTGEKYIDVFSVKLKNKNQNGKQSTFGETRDEINDRAKREISTSIINTLNGELRDQFGH